jgi:hypothetical protein
MKNQESNSEMKGYIGISNEREVKDIHRNEMKSSSYRDNMNEEIKVLYGRMNIRIFTFIYIYISI